MPTIWNENVHKQQMTRSAVPPASFPLVAPVQYSPPTVKRTMQTKVSHELMMVRRPSLSVEKDQSKTARRLQHLLREL